MSENVIVSKFGGSSMANLEAMTRSAKIASKQSSNIVVVSAVYGVTNLLVRIATEAPNGDFDSLKSVLDEINHKHHSILSEMSASDNLRENVEVLLSEVETLAKGISLIKECSPKSYDSLVSLGERLSSTIFTEVLSNINKKRKVDFLDIRKVLITDNKFTRATPLIEEIEKKCQHHLYDAKYGNMTFVTQGFVGATIHGATTTLGRGGSDYSASLIAEGIKADTLEIWTDVAGIATTDPRIVDNAKLIDEITYSEAAELATFGAKILHPTTLTPALRGDVKVFVGSSYEPDANGTWIKTEVDNPPLIRAMAKRSGQTLLTLSTPKMLNTHGFLYEIFKIFNDFNVSVDSITTSEISVAMTIESEYSKDTEFLGALKNLGDVKLENDLSLVSLIGNKINHTPNLAHRIFSCIEGINVRMICLGASKHNFCFLVKDNQVNEAIKKLHKEFIG